MALERERSQHQPGHPWPGVRRLASQWFASKPPHPARLRWLFRIWPPYAFSGIRVTDLADDWSRARVELRERWFNRNYVGTHFGGSLFAMTDPFWMILLIRRLGPGYRVWDRAAEIDFVKPGRGTVVAEFVLDEAVVAAIRNATAGGDKHLEWFETAVTDAQGEVVARVRKQVYVRRAHEPGTGKGSG